MFINKLALLVKLGQLGFEDGYFQYDPYSDAVYTALGMTENETMTNANLEHLIDDVYEKLISTNTEE